MSDYELKLTFDRPDLTYHFGEMVRGTVEVSVTSKCHCRALTLEREWRTHGRGSTESEKQAAIPLHAGEWEARRVYRYPFEFSTPNGPETYHGHNMNIDWYVRPRAVLGQALVLGVEQEILVVAQSREDRPIGTSLKGTNPVGGINLGPTYRSPGKERLCEEVSPSDRVLVGGIIILLFGLAMLAAGTELLFRSSEPWQRGFGLLVAAPIGGLMAWSAAKEVSRGFRLRGLGDFVIEIDPVVAKPGGCITCRVQLHASSAELVPRVSFTLSAREVVITGAGTAAVENAHLLYQKTLQPAPHRRVSGGFDFEARLIVPEHAPATFSGQRNRLEWIVVLRLNARALPDYKRSYPVTVCL